MTAAPQHKRLEIQKSVRQTCTDLAAKLEQLHRQVIQPVETARNAVSQTVDTVTGAVNNVGDGIAKWPWASVLGSLAAGVGTGLMTAKETSAVSTPSPMMSAGFVPQAEMPVQPGFLKKQLNKLTGVSVGAGLALVRDLVKDRIPDWSDAADQLALDLTSHLGAVPFHGTILPPASQSSVSVSTDPANDASSDGNSSFASSLYTQGA